MRKLVGALVACAFVVMSASPAFADSCANISRTAGADEEAKGRWFYLDVAQAWVFDMPNGSLLEGSAHCTGDGVPQADKNYWNWTPGQQPQAHGIVTGCGEAP
jgi:hypothetical protein